MKTERRFTAGTLELRAAGEGAMPAIRAHAIVYGSLSDNLGGRNWEWYEVVEPGAARDSLADTAQDVVAHFNHDANMVLGRRAAGTLQVGEDERGVWFEVTPPDTTWARDLIASIERGDIRGCSFAFDALTERWEIQDGKEVRRLAKIRLGDVSVVTYPAYPATNGTVGLRGEDATENLRKIYDEHKRMDAEADLEHRRMQLKLRAKML